MRFDGSLIDGRYRVERELGSGGACDVVLAEDTRLGRKVAIKIARPGSGWDVEGGLGDPQREGLLAASFVHSNIVAIFDSGRHEGLPYVVMEYVPGQSLREFLDANGPLSEEDAILLGMEIGGALAAAHARGIIHNDVKPENILLHPSGAAKLADFGIAGRYNATVSASEARELLGTMRYLAPEVLGGDRPTPASDGYSLALTLYETLVGKLPVSDSPVVAASQLAKGELPALSTLRDDLSPAFTEAISRQLRTWPEGRYTSVDAFVAAFAPARRRHDTRRIALGAAAASRAAVDPGGRKLNRRLALGSAAVVALAGVGSILAIGAMNGGGGGDSQPDDTNGNRGRTTVPVIVESTDTPTATGTATNTATNTATPTITRTPTKTATPTNTARPTNTTKPTNTVKPTNTPKATNTPRPDGPGNGPRTQEQSEDSNWWDNVFGWLPLP